MPKSFHPSKRPTSRPPRLRPTIPQIPIVVTDTHDPHWLADETLLERALRTVTEGKY